MPNDPQPDLHVVDCPLCIGGVIGSRICHLCGGFGWVAAPRPNEACPRPTRPAPRADWPGEMSE